MKVRPHPSPLEQERCHVRSWPQDVGVREKVGVGDLGAWRQSWAACSQLWEHCEEQLLHWALALGTGAALFELEATVQFRIFFIFFSSCLQGVFCLVCTIRLIRKAENSQRQVGAGSRGDYEQDLPLAWGRGCCPLRGLGDSASFFSCNWSLAIWTVSSLSCNPLYDSVLALPELAPVG